MRDRRRGGRLHLRVPNELKGQIEDYARRTHTTISDLVVRVFVQLLKTEREKQFPPDAEQV